MPARNASSEASGIWNSNAELQPTVIRPCSNTVAHSPSYSPAASSTNHCPAAGSAIDQHTQAWYRCCLQQLRKPLMTTCLGVRHKRLINNRLQAALNLFLFYSWQSSCPATSSRAKFAKHTEMLPTRVVEGSAPATMATQCSRQVASSNPMLQVSWQYACWVEKVVPGYGLGCVISTINLHHSSKLAENIQHAWQQQDNTASSLYDSSKQGKATNLATAAAGRQQQQQQQQCTLIRL